VTAQRGGQSPKLLLASAMGQHVKNAVLTGRKSGKGQFEFLSITFTHVLVSSYATSAASPNEVPPADQVSLNFASLRISYNMHKSDGSPGDMVVGGFDFNADEQI
jgi:type VI secretion system secreted protein Hcp